MRVSYGEGLASHSGPESCVFIRKGEGEALTIGATDHILTIRDRIRLPARPREILRYHIGCVRRPCEIGVLGGHPR